MVSLMSLLKKQLFPLLDSSLLRVNALDTVPPQDNLAMIVFRKMKHQVCLPPPGSHLCSVLYILGFKGDR